MKIRKLLIISTLIGLTSCSSNKSEGLTILTPTGAPAVAFYKYATDSNFSTNSGDASNIIALMVNNTKDIVVLPTNAGVQAISQKHLEYKLAATITFGNLYIVSTGNDNNATMDDGDYIVSFQKNQFPDLMFHSIYGSTLDSNLHYVSSAQQAASCLTAGMDLTNNNAKIDYVLLAEPAITTVLKNKPEYKITVNLQEEYKNKNGGSEIYQASIFVSNKIAESKIKSFLSSLEEDINKGLENPSLIVEEMSKLGDQAPTIFGIAPALINATINKIGLGYKKAIDNKQSIDKFLKVFNLEETNEEIYFK